MAIFVGYRGRKIRYVGTQVPGGLDSIELPASMSDLDPDKLFRDFEVRRGEVLPKSLDHHKQLRVAFIGVYRVPCGISTYSEWLWSEMAKQVGEYRIFAEVAPECPPEPNVVRCWRRGAPLGALIDAVLAYDPDVVYIQHEYGIFPVARHWISLITSLHSYRTIVTLHSVYTHRDKTICEAVCPEIVVHTQAGKDILKSLKEVPGRVHVIPHGCLLPQNQNKLWNLYQSQHTLIQFGFGFRYKGWENSIDVVARLRQDYPDVFFTGIFSTTEKSRDFHEEYLKELNARIDALEVREHVGITTGFQSDGCLDSFLRTNQIALFPYSPNGEHTVFGCSGAARVAMAKGIAVIASKVPLFDDLEGVCYRGDAIEGYCEEVSRLFIGENMKAQILLQNNFLRSNSWEISAKRYLDIL